MNWLQEHIDAAKGVGLVLAVCYFVYHPPTIKVGWALLYLAIQIASGVIGCFLYEAVIILAKRLGRKPEGGSLARDSEESVETKEPPIFSFLRSLRTNPIETFKTLVLLPGEDGLFFVPLLLLGINPTTALIFTGLYAFAHSGQYSARAVAGKVPGDYLVALLVLPHGLLNVILGHVIMDTAGFLVLAYWDKKDVPK